MRLLVAAFAYAHELTLSCVRIPKAQSQVRTIAKVLDVMDDCCAAIAAARFAELALLPVQSKHIPSQAKPLRPVVKQGLAVLIEKATQLRKAKRADPVHGLSPPENRKSPRH